MVLYFIITLITALCLLGYLALIKRCLVKQFQSARALRIPQFLCYVLKVISLVMTASKKATTYFVENLERHTRIDKNYWDNLVELSKINNLSLMKQRYKCGDVFTFVQMAS